MDKYDRIAAELSRVERLPMPGSLYVLKTLGEPTSNPMSYRAALDARNAWRKAKALELRGKAAGAASAALARSRRDPGLVREVARENGKGGGRPNRSGAPPRDWAWRQAVGESATRSRGRGSWIAIIRAKVATVIPGSAGDIFQARAALKAWRLARAEELRAEKKGER